MVPNRFGTCHGSHIVGSVRNKGILKPTRPLQVLSFVKTTPRVTPPFGERELLATLLDVRTLGCAHLTSDQRHQAQELYETAYVGFASNVAEYTLLMSKAWEQKANEQAAAARAAMAMQSDSGPSTEQPVEREAKVPSGVTFGVSGWSDEEDDEVEVGNMGGEPPSPVELKEFYISEARKVFLQDEPTT